MVEEAVVVLLTEVKAGTAETAPIAMKTERAEKARIVTVNNL